MTPQERHLDKYNQMLFDETGFVDSKGISWKLVAIPIIKKAEEKARQAERQRLKEEIKKLKNVDKRKKIVDWILYGDLIRKEEVLALLEEK